MLKSTQKFLSITLLSPSAHSLRSSQPAHAANTGGSAWNGAGIKERLGLHRTGRWNIRRGRANRVSIFSRYGSTSLRHGNIPKNSQPLRSFRSIPDRVMRTDIRRVTEYSYTD